MFTLSGFADEISPELNEQIKVLTKLDIRHIELRGVWGKNVLALDDVEVALIQQTLQANGIQVSAIGSPIGKIRVDDPFEPHLKSFRRALDLALLFQSPYIRIFSFYVSAGEAARYRSEVMDRMRALLDMAKGVPVILLHENESHIYGDTPERCLDIHETLNSQQLRATFDPANFVMNGIHPYTDAYPLLAEWIEYLHIKDGVMSDRRVVPAGQGDGQIREVVLALKERGFNGFASLEPHLASAGALSGYSGPELFSTAVQAFRELLSAAGV
ncbi:MAG: sugar phosphate isomerase/epimerase family protein [Anaerolineae bacterium]